ncbi:hypothetical protein NOVO_08570 [Rickettsiales bacterium Ac37b]|nr:hypothetical protein NOVO_08570 [Rickettsiales bacterium Ac37b]
MATPNNSFINLDVFKNTTSLEEDFVIIEPALNSKKAQSLEMKNDVEIKEEDFIVLESQAHNSVARVTVDEDEIDEDDFVKIEMPSMFHEENDWVIINKDAVEFCPELPLPRNNLLEYVRNSYKYLKDTYNDNMQAVKDIISPESTPISRALATTTNIYKHAKNIALIGSAIGFMVLHPTLALCVVGASIGACIYDNFIKDDNKRPWTNFMLGTSLYTAAAVSLFTAPWLALGLGFGCGSYIKNMTKALPLAVAGISVPDYLAGPLSLIAGFGIKAAERVFGYTLPENCFVNRMYKYGIGATTSVASSALIYFGYKHFETMGDNFINVVANTMALPIKGYNAIMDYYKPERSFVIIDESEQEMRQTAQVEEKFIPNNTSKAAIGLENFISNNMKCSMSFVERLMQDRTLVNAAKKCSGMFV